MQRHSVETSWSRIKNLAFELLTDWIFNFGFFGTCFVTNLLSDHLTNVVPALLVPGRWSAFVKFWRAHLRLRLKNTWSRPAKWHLHIKPLGKPNGVLLLPPEACVFSSYICVYFNCRKYSVVFLLALSVTAKNLILIFFILTSNKISFLYFDQ